VVLTHTWLLHSGMWEYQFHALVEAGLRCVGYDRRGHGRSDAPGGGYDYDTLAGDLAVLLETLDLRGVTLVGHSMGGGEIVGYLSRHGRERVARIALIAAPLSGLCATPDNPGPIDPLTSQVFVNEIEIRSDRPRFYAAWRQAYFAPIWATTFPEGKPRNRAMGVCAAMSVAGGAIGLIAGDRLTTYISWRWVLFVNVPIGLAAAFAAPRVLAESRRRGRFDLPGAVTGTGGLAALVYGLSNAATSPHGVSHWGDAKVVAALAASAVLLAAFAVIEARSKHPVLPLRLLADRNRTGANLVMLCVGTALFGRFCFLTLFMQVVWGYSALQAGVAYLPLSATIMMSSDAAARRVARTGARPLLLAGATAVASGLYWLSRAGEHGSYLSAVLGPMLVTAAGLGLLFVPLTLVAMSRVAETGSGAASSLRTTGQQVGGSIGLAVLGTAARTVAASSIRTPGRPGPGRGQPRRPP